MSFERGTGLGKEDSLRNIMFCRTFVGDELREVDLEGGDGLIAICIDPHTRRLVCLTGDHNVGEVPAMNDGIIRIEDFLFPPDPGRSHASLPTRARHILSPNQPSIQISAHQAK